MHHLSVFIFLLVSAHGAFAHEGHGLEGAHSHLSDHWGFLVMGLVAAFAFWFTRKK